MDEYLSLISLLLPQHGVLSHFVSDAIWVGIGEDVGEETIPSATCTPFTGKQAGILV
jgi:hypothetical protein